MQEWSSRIEFNRAHQAIGKSTEVAAEMGDEVGAGDKENDATDEPLKRDQTDYPPTLRGVTSLRHLETLAGVQECPLGLLADGVAGVVAEGDLAIVTPVMTV